MDSVPELSFENRTDGKIKGGIVMRKEMVVSVVLFVCILATGCATNNSVHFGDISNLQGGEVTRAKGQESAQKVDVVSTESDGKKSVRIPTDPYHTLGVLKTKAVASSNVTTVEGILLDLRFGEYFPGRIGSKCWAVTPQGKELFCQSVLYRIGEDGLFREAHMVEGSPEEVHKSSILVLSTIADFGYDLKGNEIKLGKEFKENGEYRRKLVLEKGTKASEVPLVDGFGKMVLRWNEYSTPEGLFLSPLGTEELKYIAGINPQYTFLDKLIGTGNFTLTPDPTGVIAGLAIDTFKAMDAPSTGWDYNSQLPNRRNMGFIIQYVGNLRQGFLAQATQQVAAVQNADAIQNNLSEKKLSWSEEMGITLQLLGYTPEISLSLAKEMEDKKSKKVRVRKNERVVALISKGKINKDNDAKITWNGKLDSIEVDQYQVIVGGVRYTALRFVESETLIRMPETTSDGRKLAPAFSDIRPKAPESAGTSQKPQGQEKETKLVHEPNFGVFGGQSKVTKWGGGYIEYTVSPDTGEDFVPEAGFLVSGTKGSMKDSTYSYKEVKFGPQVGFKYFWEDAEANPGALDAKIRLLWERLEGHNREGYAMKQKGINLQARVDAQKQVKDDLRLGVVIEGTLPLSKSISSTWSGDKPSNRTSLEAGVYGIKQLNDKLEYEVYVGVMYTGWDKLWGVKVIPLELIYDKWLKAGIGVSFFPFNLGNYKGIYKAGKLTTLWGFVQVDAGPIIRRAREKEAMERVQPVSKQAPAGGFTKPAVASTVSSAPEKPKVAKVVVENGRYKTVYDPKYPNIKPRKFDTDPIWYQDIK